MVLITWALQKFGHPCDQVICIKPSSKQKQNAPNFITKNDLPKQRKKGGKTSAHFQFHHSAYNQNRAGKMRGKTLIFYNVPPIFIQYTLRL